jgi:DHA1 family tetracycline resistance protein-like MFS transporter
VQGGLTKHAVAALGERRAALTGFAIGAVAYLGYGFADQGWMIYLLIAFGALGGFAQPALQAIMSRAMPANAQGELQGMVGALQGLSMIIGPYVMTQVFAAFIAPGEPLTLAGVTLLPDGAPFRFPGASFVLASCLTAISLVILVFAFQKMERAAPAAQSSAAE